MKHIPVATYRLQFNGDFTFLQATEILDYLQALGISDVYASPLFAAGPESTHGYDVCCFSRFNPALGTELDFEKFHAALHSRGLGLLLDMVPNHMSATSANAWWLDVLENGRASRYADFFDINWDSNTPSLRNKVLLPVLEDHYGTVLEGGKLKLVFENGKFFIAYFDRRFPVNGSTLLPDESSWDIPQILHAFNGESGNAGSFQRLDGLIRRQHYRLAYWRVAAEEINYRRFFDVTELVALRMELPEVFDATHNFLFRLLRTGKVSGLRIDHPDGLSNPKEYFQRLRTVGPFFVVAEKILSEGESLPSDWHIDGTTGYDFLNRVNGLFINPANASALDGTYRQFAGCNRPFADIAHESKKQILRGSFSSEMDSLTRRLQVVAANSCDGRDFTVAQLRLALEEVIANFPVYRSYITEETGAVSPADDVAIATAVRHAEQRISVVPEASRAAITFLGRVLLLQHLVGASAADRKAILDFILKFQQLTGPAAAKGIEDTAFYRFHRLISLNEVGGAPDHFGVAPAEFHDANQRIAERRPSSLLATATHDTKRGEDVRARINVLSEMPFEWSEAVARWSRRNSDRKKNSDGTPAPSTNDEYLLYQTLVGAWPGSKDAAGCKTHTSTAFKDRITAFMLKAAKEAKVHTSWTEPNAAYETALQNFIEQSLSDEDGFVKDLRKFQQRVAFFGRINSLAQTLLKLTCPGVPDMYQGCELWDFSLVDPDNRRPVDFSLRRHVLSQVKELADTPEAGESLSRLLVKDELGATKLFLIWRVLNFRHQKKQLFETGAYVPLIATGAKHDHVCSFARTGAKGTIVIIVPRLVCGLTEGAELLPLGSNVWRDTALPLTSLSAMTFRNVITDETIPVVERNGTRSIEVADAMQFFPVALLSAVEA